MKALLVVVIWLVDAFSLGSNGLQQQFIVADNKLLATNAVTFRAIRQSSFASDYH